MAVFPLVALSLQRVVPTAFLSKLDRGFTYANPLTPGFRLEILIFHTKHLLQQLPQRLLIPVVYTINAQGDISVSGLPLDTYTVEVTGSLAYENDYTSVTSISVPNTTHGKGLHPGVQLYLGGQTIPA